MTEASPERVTEPAPDAAEYSWTVDSALWQIQHGEPGTDRLESAIAWIRESAGRR